MAHPEDPHHHHGAVVGELPARDPCDLAGGDEAGEAPRTPHELERAARAR